MGEGFATGAGAGEARGEEVSMGAGRMVNSIAGGVGLLVGVGIEIAGFAVVGSWGVREGDEEEVTGDPFPSGTSWTCSEHGVLDTWQEKTLQHICVFTKVILTIPCVSRRCLVYSSLSGMEIPRSPARERGINGKSSTIGIPSANNLIFVVL
jgi:hypothetical protein